MPKDIEKMYDSEIGSGVRLDPCDIYNLDEKGMAPEGKWPKLLLSKLYRKAAIRRKHTRSSDGGHNPFWVTLNVTTPLSATSALPIVVEYKGGGETSIAIPQCWSSMRSTSRTTL
jgi:hypothetical protein